MTTDHNELRRLAELATPGPYGWDALVKEDVRYHHIMAVGNSPACGQGIADTYHHRAVEGYYPARHGRKEDADYLAAVDPQTIISLLDQIVALTARAQAAEAQARGYELRFKTLEPKLRDCEGALVATRGELEETRSQWVKMQLELGKQCVIRDEKAEELYRLQSALADLRERCKQAALNEKVSGETGDESDIGYNQAIDDVVAVIDALELEAEREEAK